MRGSKIQHLLGGYRGHKFSNARFGIKREMGQNILFSDVQQKAPSIAKSLEHWVW